MSSPAAADATPPRPQRVRDDTESVSLEQMECACDVHILVIDDDDTTCRVIRDALAHKDFRIRTVSDCNQVEAALQHSPLHLIVLDYVLPGLDHEQVLTWMQTYQPDAQFIVITGYPSMEGVQTALRARAYDYITKPFPLVHLRHAVMKCLQSQGLLRMTADALREAVGAALRERRKALDLTLADMVKKTGLSMGYLSQIELGKNAASIETLYRLCLALKVKLSELFADM